MKLTLVRAGKRKRLGLAQFYSILRSNQNARSGGVRFFCSIFLTIFHCPELSFFSKIDLKERVYAVVSKLATETPEYQCSILRYCFTEETRKIYNTLTRTDDEKKDPKVIMEKLENHGTVNETMERHLFNSRNHKKKGNPLTTFSQN